MIMQIDLQAGGTIPNLCRNCAHYIPFPSEVLKDNSLGQCGRAQKVLSPVTGYERHRFAENERLENGACGPEGKFFEAAPEITARP